MSQRSNAARSWRTISKRCALLGLLLAAGCEELAPRCSQAMIPWYSADSCEANQEVYTHVPDKGICELRDYGGCGASQNIFDSLEECESVCEVTPTPCLITATDPSLPGVEVRIDSERCRVPSRSRSEFRYVVWIKQPIDYNVPAPTPGCELCTGIDSNPYWPDYLVQKEVGAGDLWFDARNGARCCDPASVSRTLYPAAFHGVIDWNGRTSPTEITPQGVPFPSGKYDVRVTFEVPGVGAVVARLPIDVVNTYEMDGGVALGDH